MDMIPDQLEKFILRPVPRLLTPIRYRWEITGVGARNLDILWEGDNATVELAGTGVADVTFRCDAETFALIVFGRFTIDKSTAAGKLAIQGDNGLSIDFERWFAWR